MLDSLLSSSCPTSLEERVEAAGVLAQITSPWITDNHKIADLDQHVPSMVASLTSECEDHLFSLYLIFNPL